MVRKLLKYTICVVFVLILIYGGDENRGISAKDLDNPVSLFVVRHTWHTGIILENDRHTSHYNLFDKTFPGAKFIEFGWGDFDFFRSDRATFGMAARAILWPTGSVLHLMPYYRDPAGFFPEERIIRINITDSDVQDLISRLESSFQKDEDGNYVVLDADNPVGGRFYLSGEKYHLFKTCNAWTARVLRRGGYPVSPFMVFGPEGLMGQVRRLEDRRR